MTRPPWSPTGISLVTLLLSPVAGAILHALNYSRLGWPQRRRLALYSNLFAALTVVVVAGLTPMRGLTLMVAIFFAAYFYKTQEASFARHRAAGGRKSSLVLPVVLLIVMVVVLNALLAIGELIG